MSAQGTQLPDAGSDLLRRVAVQIGDPDHRVPGLRNLTAGTARRPGTSLSRVS